MTFWDFLSDNTPLVTLLGVLVVVVILYVGKVLGLKKLGPGGAEFFTKGYGGFTAWLIREESKISEQRADMVQRHTMMRVHYLVRDQMNMVEQYLTEIKFIASQSFVNLLREHCENLLDLVHNPDFVRFERELDAAADQLKTLVRFAVKENHLAEKDHDEFVRYVKSKVDYISTQMRQYVMRIPSIGCIDADMFLTEVGKYEATILETYRKIFELARQQSIAYESAMAKEEADLMAVRESFYNELPKKLKELAS